MKILPLQNHLVGLTASFAFLCGCLSSPQLALSQQIQVKLAQRNVSAEAIDIFTDRFFYQANPNMQGLKIQLEDVSHQRQWNAIRLVVRSHIKQFDCGNFFVGSYDDVADAIFYARNPWLNGRAIRSSEYDLAQEWKSIRAKLRNPSDAQCL
ncbi:hypothetical protein TUMEXPCC7403_23600 [Tumidithrix helvetica PCC 7403]|uniref:hypothetical protein n=1 Tax=Tumidithrix helvetica TaxID=3457545 RepID=UPI003C9237AC